MSDSNDTIVLLDDIVTCTGTSDVSITTPHYDIEGLTISTNSVDTVNVSDYTFTLADDVISFDNLTTTGSPTITGFGTEWVDHLPAMSVVQDMCKHYPALEKALENFKTVYKMVEQDYKGNHENDLW